MNKRIKRLAEQADLFWSERDGWWVAYEDSNDLERFAELVRQDEREKCAKLVFEMAQLPKFDAVWAALHEAQSAIKARTE